MLQRHIRRNLIIEESDSDPSDDELEERARSALEAKLLRDQSDPFRMTEKKFREMFRLSRSFARELLDEIMVGNSTLRDVYISAIPFHLRYLAALSFLGHGSYQKPVGYNHVICQSQSSISRSLHIVVDEIIKLIGKYVRFPRTPAEFATAKADFLTQLGMPGIVCAIDGTHVAIVKPTDAQEGHTYCNRKSIFTLNVLAACDANQLFVYANANFPGSTHDSAIYQMSSIKNWMPDNAYMLGDSGFASDRCVLTPSPNAPPGSKAEQYNVAHKSARNVIERTFGVLKMRFRCLSRHRALHYAPAMSGKIVYACIVLHNLCIMRKLDLNAAERENPEAEEAEVVVPAVERRMEINAGRRIRDEYINRNF